MLKSECDNNRETTETNEVTRTLQQINNRFWRRCFYKRVFTRVEFLHHREKTKRKLFTDLRGIRSTCGAEE